MNALEEKVLNHGHGTVERDYGVIRVILIVYRPLLTEVSTFSQIPVLVRSAITFSLISLMLKKEFLSALMRMMATLSSAQI